MIRTMNATAMEAFLREELHMQLLRKEQYQRFGRVSVKSKVLRTLRSRARKNSAVCVCVCVCACVFHSTLCCVFVLSLSLRLGVLIMSVCL